MDRVISAEYILFACDDNFDLAEKICRRLDGLRLNFSIAQLNKIKAQKLLLKGECVNVIAHNLGMKHDTVRYIRRQMIKDGIEYYTGEDND